MPEPSTQRDLRLDFFRGVSLIFIFIDHIPENVLSYFTLQSDPFFDAAEVFIFISGFTAALVYGRRLASKGALYATAQVLRRAWQLYVAHIFLFVLFVAEVSYTATAFKNPMYNEEMRVADFLDEPHVAVVKALLLEFQPAFLDILPMYIVMLVIFPAVLLGMRAALAAGAGALGAALPRGPDLRHLGAGLPGGPCLVFQPARLAVPVRRRGGAGATRATRAQTLRRPCCGWLYPVAAVRRSPAALVVKVSWTMHGVLGAVPGAAS